MKRIQQLSFLFLSLLLLNACGPKQETKSEEEEEQVSEAFAEERQEFFNRIVEPDETAARLMSIGADYNASLLYDPTKWSTYTSSNNKAAAMLGIYLSDLNYSVAFKQSDKTAELFEAIHSLSLQIGVEKSVLQFLMDRYKNNIDQNDSLKASLNGMYSNAIQSTKGTDREILTGIAIGTHQVEDLHLMLGIIQTYPKDGLPDDVRTQILIPLFKAVLEERAMIESAYNFLKTIVPEEDSNNFYLTSFKDLLDTYDELDIDEKIANNQGLELMNDAVVQKLSAKVSAIRNELTSSPE